MKRINTKDVLATKLGDENDSWELELIDDNRIKSLENSSVEVKVKNASGYLITLGSSIKDNRVVISTNDLSFRKLPNGRYSMEIDVTENGLVSRYPTIGFLDF